MREDGWAPEEHNAAERALRDAAENVANRTIAAWQLLQDARRRQQQAEEAATRALYETEVVAERAKAEADLYLGRWCDDDAIHRLLVAEADRHADEAAEKLARWHEQEDAQASRDCDDRAEQETEQYAGTARDEDGD